MRTLVVGAGSGGAVVASRLSEDASPDVVLLEAGPDHPRAAEAPETLPGSGARCRWGSLAVAWWAGRPP